ITKLFEKVTVKIFYKEIDHVIMDGGGSLESVGPIISKQLIANLRGTGRLEIEVECDYFEALMRGTSMFTVSGKTEHAIANVKGMGSIMAKDLIASNVNITVDGVGSSTVYASENLEATLNGVGSIKYLGNPKEKDFDVNGLGSIQPYEGD
ncbi:MAG: DUF2807 domain-containing protein, partial [Bacteroidales bacterium]|nr:DUF2807 domain-containing protein [Bacteroidales bacterium]